MTSPLDHRTAAERRLYRGKTFISALRDHCIRKTAWSMTSSARSVHANRPMAMQNMPIRAGWHLQKSCGGMLGFWKAAIANQGARPVNSRAACEAAHFHSVVHKADLVCSVFVVPTLRHLG